VLICALWTPTQLAGRQAGQRVGRRISGPRYRDGLYRFAFNAQSVISLLWAALRFPRLPDRDLYHVLRALPEGGALSGPRSPTRIGMPRRVALPAVWVSTEHRRGNRVRRRSPRARRLRPTGADTGRARSVTPGASRGREGLGGCSLPLTLGDSPDDEGTLLRTSSLGRSSSRTHDVWVE
jgi:hypothetical protein